MNHRVTVEENNYPLKNGIATLVGIYNDKPSAEFIANEITKKFKINGNILIEEVDPIQFPLTSDKVSDYLKRQT
jgi:hypothetical protein